MKRLGHLILLVYYISVTNSSVFSGLKTNILTLLKSHRNQQANDEEVRQTQKNDEWAKKWQFGISKKNRGNVYVLTPENHLRRWPKTDKTYTKRSNKLKHSELFKKLEDFKTGNDIREDNFKYKFEVNPEDQEDLAAKFLPFYGYRRAISDSDSNSSSSSRELKSWKEEFRDEWLHKKFEALNSTMPAGDQINFVAARPWGVPCGDPNQHDMPWGHCVLAMECEPEYRIYRGDLVCGRTRFICCALKTNVYDLYQGFDISLKDKSLSTTSEERRGSTGNSVEKRKKKRERDRKKRKKDRNARKKKIKRDIRKINKEVRKILDKQLRNSTKAKKKKTKKLKKFLKKLKKQYRKDRDAVKNLNEKNSLNIDKALAIKLEHIKSMNKNFVHNDTFRDIIINGKVTKEGLRMLLEAYPDLKDDIEHHLSRRSGGDAPISLEYDIEYGYIYY